MRTAKVVVGQASSVSGNKGPWGLKGSGEPRGALWSWGLLSLALGSLLCRVTVRLQLGSHNVVWVGANQPEEGVLEPRVLAPPTLWGWGRAGSKAQRLSPVPCFGLVSPLSACPFSPHPTSTSVL